MGIDCTVRIDDLTALKSNVWSARTLPHSSPSGGVFLWAPGLGGRYAASLALMPFFFNIDRDDIDRLSPPRAAFVLFASSRPAFRPLVGSLRAVV
jgi:hypothetical protein